MRVVIVFVDVCWVLVGFVWIVGAVVVDDWVVDGEVV